MRGKHARREKVCPLPNRPTLSPHSSVQSCTDELGQLIEDEKAWILWSVLVIDARASIAYNISHGESLLCQCDIWENVVCACYVIVASGTWWLRRPCSAANAQRDISRLFSTTRQFRAQIVRKTCCSNTEREMTWRDSWFFHVRSELLFKKRLWPIC